MTVVTVKVRFSAARRRGGRGRLAGWRLTVEQHLVALAPGLALEDAGAGGACEFQFLVNFKRFEGRVAVSNLLSVSPCPNKVYYSKDVRRIHIDLIR